jgi:phosphatidylethanolamine-binding protein (PEBP) family uncharacterized protein
MGMSGMTSMAGMASAGMPAGGMGGAPAGMSGMNAGGMAAGGDGMGGNGMGDAGMGGSSMGGEFVLTAPWEHVETCSPDDNSTCSSIPVENRSNFIGGGDQMPALSWTAGPDGTMSYAVVYHDLSNGMVHWALWNIPASVTSVDGDNIPPEADESSAVGNSWFGSGACGNVYELVVYALSVEAYNAGGNHTAVRDGLDGADSGLVLARDEIRGSTLDPCN